MKNPTPTEFLIHHILNSEFETDDQWQKVFEQSKEMYEREITKAYHEGQLMVLKIIKENLPNFISTSDENDLSDANEYYKNTYEKES